MYPAARLGDNHTCPMINPDGSPHTGGPIAEGDDSVLIGDMSAARCGDSVTCVGASDVIATGADAVLIGDRPAAALGDLTEHGGLIAEGETRVLIGSDTAGGGGDTGATQRAARNEARPFTDVTADGQGDS